MKLDSFEPSFEQDQIKIRELEYLLQQPSYLESRPCARCDKECDCSQSLSCPCICGPDCEHAPSAMSSDPTRYPIEKKIVTLVFSFNCLRVCPPYWSCEGHNFKNGELFRVPQVWFYSKSMIYPKLIDEYVLGLQRENLIAYPWHVCLAYAENSLETGFSIEPDVKAIERPELETLQEDVGVISNNLFNGLKNLAEEHIKRYQSKISHNK